MSDSGSTQTIEPPTVERRTTGRSIGVVVCVVLAVLLTTLAFNLLGDGLRDAFDPRSAR